MTTIIVLSAELAGLSDAHNFERMSQLDGKLLAMLLRSEIQGYRRVTGRYRGTSEQAFLVEIDYRSSRQTNSGVALAKLAVEYGQESILAIDVDGRAALIFCTGERKGEVEVLGVWQRFDPFAIGDEPEAYTIDNGQYWLAGPPLPLTVVNVPYDEAWASYHCALPGYN